MTPRLQEELDALSKEELRGLRRRIKAALPREWQMAMLSGREEDRIPQEEYDKFVSTQLQLYKKERAAQESMAQATG